MDLTAEISPGITARVARPDDLERFDALISLTGAAADDYMGEMLRSEDLAAAVLAGAEHGHDRFQFELVRRLAGSPSPEAATLATTLPLVAVTPDDEVVGALLAYPPPNLIEQTPTGSRGATAEWCPVLLIHGWAQTWNSLRMQMPALAREVRVTTP